MEIPRFLYLNSKSAGKKHSKAKFTSEIQCYIGNQEIYLINTKDGCELSIDIHLKREGYNKIFI